VNATLTAFAGLLLAAAPGFAAGAPATVLATSPADVVARVGQSTITRGELDALFSMAPADLRKSGERAYLTETVKFRTLLELARKRGLESNPAVLARLRPRLREQLARLAVVEEMARKPAPDEAAVRKVYEARKALLVEPESVEAVRLQASSEADARGFKFVAERAGGIAGLGPQLKTRVRDLGRLYPGSVAAPLFEFLLRQKLGVISAPFEDSEGWAAFLVRAHLPERARTFDEVKETLRQELESQREQEAIAALLAECGKRWPVTLHPEKLHDPEPQAVVAVVGEQKLRRQELLAEVAQAQGVAREFLTRPEGSQMLLTRMAQQACLAQLAEANPDLVRKYGRQVQYLKDRELVDTLLHEECYTRVRIDEAEARRHYTENLARFGREQVMSSHILFSKKKGDGTKKALAALERLRRGEDFAALARELSDDEATKVKGGSLGWFGRALLVEPYARAAFSMAAGQVTSQPVESIYGTHLIKVEAVQKAVPFEQVRSAVVTELTEMRRKTAYDRFLENASNELVVKVMPESLPPDPVPAQDPREASMMRITVTSEGTVEIQPAKNK
jgi:parvulin-like peptidyl-prolyl isomerase